MRTRLAWIKHPLRDIAVERNVLIGYTTTWLDALRMGREAKIDWLVGGSDARREYHKVVK